MKLLFAILALPLLAFSTAPAAPHPNIVVVLLDDMGWGDFSCFGNKDAKTPHVDRLAAEGIRFTQFYVNSPICSPSRCALTTGQYPQRWRINPHFPACRSDSMALSGASRRKQSPSSGSSDGWFS